MLQKWYQYKEKNRFNKERIDLRLRRFFSPTLKFTNSTPHPKSFWRISKRHLVKTFPLAFIFVGAFTVAFISSKQEAPTNPTNALADNNYTLSLSVDQPNLNLEVDATPDGGIVMGKHNVTINTNNPNGTKLVIKDNSSLVADSNGDLVISSTHGTLESPVKLHRDDYGFAVPKGVSAKSEKFSEETAYQNSSPDALFSSFGCDDIIYQGPSKTFPVYYGFNISTLPTGSYHMDILYTAISLASPTPQDNIEVSPNKITNPNEKATITVKTSIKSDKPIGPDALGVRIAGEYCTDINITKDYPNVLEFTCKAPKHAEVNGDGKKTLDIMLTGDSILEVADAVEYITHTPMQSFTYQDCDNMTQHQVKYLKDTRDNEIYTVSKLKDGKCWMTQNLRLKLSTSKALTPADSDVATTWTVPAGRDTQTTTGQRWDRDPEGEKTVRSYINPSAPNDGAYYTHSAATVQSANNIENDGGEAPSSICPKGWRLPKTTNQATNSEFYKLAQKYINSNMQWKTYDNGNGGYWNNGSHNMLSSPQNFIYSGYYGYYNGSLNYVGSRGYWWSSTVRNSSYVYLMYMDSSNVNPRGNYDRYNGFSVRCVVKEAYLQDFTEQDCNNMTEHQTKTLTDSRDGEKYTVAKLKDGRCWMTQNLRLKLNTSTTLTPANTDISSNWTPNRSTEVSNGTGGSGGSGSGAVWRNDSEGYKTVRSIYRTPTYNTHGVYYTHSAATAQSANNIDTNGQNAPHSICPKGWRLPTSSNINGQGDFWQLADKYKGSATWQNNNNYLSGSHTLMQAPASFPLSGAYDYGGYFNLVDSYGYWWSSTVNSSNFAYYLLQNSSALYPHYYWTRYNGFSVRCVAR